MALVAMLCQGKVSSPQRTSTTMPQPCSKAAFGKHWLDVVVCRYRCGVSDLADTFRSVNARVLVYDKNVANPLAEAPGYTRLHARNPPGGQEGYVYLRHIIDRYDKLAEYTLFVQDDLGNHIGAQGAEKLLKFALDAAQRCAEFQQHPTMWGQGRNCSGGSNSTPRSIPRIFRNGSYRLHTMPNGGNGVLWDFAKRFCLPQVEWFATLTGAFFIASRDGILQHSVRYYESILEWMLAQSSNGFVLEHAWKLVLDSSYRTLTPSCDLSR